MSPGSRGAKPDRGVDKEAENGIWEVRLGDRMGKIPLIELGTGSPFLVGFRTEPPGTLPSGNTPCPRASEQAGARAVSWYSFS